MISVIIPAYNEEKYIGNCLDSLISQTLPADEIVVCNNHSTDNTQNILKNYQNKLPLKIVFQPQKGISRALQTAWLATSGDIICRTDADSRPPPNWLKNINRHFQQVPNLDVCYGSYSAYDGAWSIKTIMRLAVPFSQIYYPLFKGYRFIPGANYAIKRQAMISINGYLPISADYPEDILFSQKIAKYKLKIKKYSDCLNITSTRRFQNPQELVSAFKSIFINPAYYQEKK